MITHPLFLRVRDYFLLEAAERQANALDPDTRARSVRDVALSRQRLIAAECLWESGSPAEGLRLVREAFVLLDDLLEVHAIPLESGREELRARAAIPMLDSAIGAPERALFRALLRYSRAMLDRLALVAATDRERSRIRSGRVGTFAIVFVLAVSTFLWIRLHRSLDATASESWGGKFPPSHAVDRSESSHWLLPDGRTGWLDIEIHPPRRVGTVAILNGYEPAYSVVDYRLEARLGDQVVKVADGTLPLSRLAKPPWETIPFVTAQRVDHIRIYVKSFKGLGGGLAEVAIY